MKYVLVLLLLLNVACGQAQEPCGFRRNDHGQRISWKNNLPIKISLDPNGPLLFNKPIQNALETWNKAAKRTLFVNTGIQSVHNISFLNPWSGPSLQEANTTFSFYLSVIYYAEIRVNLQNYKFSQNPNFNEVDAESLILHEMGHFLGLMHVEDQESVMNPSLSEGEIRRKLYEIDIKNLRCEY